MERKPQILVCVNTRMGDAPSCGALGSRALLEPLQQAVAQRGIDLDVVASVCLGQCSKGPNIRIVPGGPFAHACTADQADQALDHILSRWPRSD